MIVNGDDFGLSEKINDGILRAHRNGILTSASLVANGAAFEHAVELCHSTPTLDVGVHLTLVEERPLSNWRDVPSIVDRTGRFYPNARAFTQRLLVSRISLQEVRHELDLQIRRVLGSGLQVSHLDGHQHLHMLPRIRRVVGELGEKYNIPAVRYPKEKLKNYMFKERGSLSRIIQLVVLNVFCTMCNVGGDRRPDYFVGFFYGGRLHKENLKTILKNLPTDGICELMCHPGLNDAGSSYHHWRYNWQEELNALTDPEIKDLLRKTGVSLISYREVAHS